MPQNNTDLILKYLRFRFFPHISFLENIHYFWFHLETQARNEAEMQTHLITAFHAVSSRLLSQMEWYISLWGLIEDDGLSSTQWATFGFGFSPVF